MVRGISRGRARVAVLRPGARLGDVRRPGQQLNSVALSTGADAPIPGSGGQTSRESEWL